MGESIKDTTQKKCPHCSKENIETRRIATPMLVSFEFKLRFIKNIMMPISHGSNEDWGIDEICESCARRLKQVLLDNGFKIRDYSSEW